MTASSFSRTSAQEIRGQSQKRHAQRHEVRFIRVGAKFCGFVLGLFAPPGLDKMEARKHDDEPPPDTRIFQREKHRNGMHRDTKRH